MTTEEARRFFAELPEVVAVPTSIGDVEMVPKRQLTREHLQRIAVDLLQQRQSVEAEAEGVHCCRRRHCAPRLQARPADGGGLSGGHDGCLGQIARHAGAVIEREEWCCHGRSRRDHRSRLLQ